VHAKALAANRAKRMVIEGHTDERGGREYNLALGQKRAEAVVRSLALLGADEKQLEAVSFGKERPAVEGSDEAAGAKNRRAELKDR
jgi:peptidoglycan-associated lipoprotein